MLLDGLPHRFRCRRFEVDRPRAGTQGKLIVSPLPNACPIGAWQRKTSAGPAARAEGEVGRGDLGDVSCAGILGHAGGAAGVVDAGAVQGCGGVYRRVGRLTCVDRGDRVRPARHGLGVPDRGDRERMLAEGLHQRRAVLAPADDRGLLGVLEDEPQLAGGLDGGAGHDPAAEAPDCQVHHRGDRALAEPGDDQVARADAERAQAGCQRADRLDKAAEAAGVGPAVPAEAGHHGAESSHS
ncbi:hypothetical protein L3X23_18875 [Pseudonocardia sp. WMMC193]|nr:hypothetical protein [Pseudonocardia sp. WMMC193]MCF7550836.1 hypothetical protein [Pseudonocardia sp. WMMC193]